MFCTGRFGITFPQFSKINVNGKNESPLYTFLKKEKGGALGSRIKWNFTKFLVAKDGNPFMLVECKTSPKEPLSESLTAFQTSLSVPYAFQVAVHADKTDIDPTEYKSVAIKISVLDLMKVLV